MMALNRRFRAQKLSGFRVRFLLGLGGFRYGLRVLGFWFTWALRERKILARQSWKLPCTPLFYVGIGLNSL